MKKHTINFSWPAALSFSAEKRDENECFSRGKLEVFYQGETADHRFFSKEFSNELIKSLPYTPIVSHYDEDKDDFVGHATQQDIYGIVDPCGEISFVTKDDGNTWCVCDTVYYTERPDKVGEIAKKIEGHSQSLELDPSSVKYTVNYDEKRHFKNIEFTAGKFVGVSVLGKDQRPAFTGSSFFSCDDAFVEKMKLLRDYCEAKHDQNNIEGRIMNLEEFMKLSWGDISNKVAEALRAEYREEAYTYIVDMFEDSVIVHFYSYIDDTAKLVRVSYSCDDNGIVSLGNAHEVRIAYEDVTENKEIGVEQATVTNSVEESVTEPSNESTLETPVVMETSTDEQTPVTEESAILEESTIAVDEASTNIDVAPVTNAEVTQTPEEVSVENEQTKEENSSATSFTKSERAELENLKREKKLNLLESYKEYISNEEYTDYSVKIDSFDFNDLEMELLKKYKTHQETSLRKPMRAFALDSLNLNSAKNELDDFVRRNLNR